MWAPVVFLCHCHTATIAFACLNILNQEQVVLLKRLFINNRMNRTIHYCTEVDSALARQLFSVILCIHSFFYEVAFCKVVVYNLMNGILI